MPYIGQPPVSGDTTKSFRLLDNLASFTLTFDATSSSVVDTTANTLTFANHRFVTAQRVTYTDGGGTAIGGLSDGTAYFVIKVDQNTIQLASSASNANNSTAISLSAGAAGGSHTLNIAFDGTNTKFKVTYGNGTKAKISRAGQLLISINGVLQQAQESSTPTLGFGLDSDSTIVFSQAPVSTDVLFGQILADTIANFDTQDNTLDVFTGDGSTTGFTLSKKPASNNDILVTLDGVVQYPTTTSTSNAYSVAENTLTFTSAPANGVAIQVRHIGFAGATSSAVTGLYGRTGNVTLSSSDDDITVGNVTAGIITATSYGSISGTTASFSGNVSIGGTLTYEDVTNIDSVGLITARSGIVVTGGSVGIGLVNPEDKLHVKSGKIRIENAIVSNNDSTIAYDNDTFIIDVDPNNVRGSSAFKVNVDTVNGLIVDENRRVGLGTQVPGALLSLESTAANAAKIRLGFDGSRYYDIFRGSTTNSGYLNFYGSQSSYVGYVFGGVDGEWMRIDTSGRLLLGTTTEGNAAADNLTVAGSAACGISIRSGTSANGALYFSDGTSGNDEFRGYIIYEHNTNALRFATDATERLRITSDGKIGINNNAPLYAMHFKNAMASSPSFIHMEATGSNAVGGGGGIAFDTSASNSDSNNGLYLATIKGIRNSDDDGSNDLVFSTTKSGANGDDGNANTPKERLRITSTGFVGIGEDAPDSLLHIGKGTNTDDGAVTFTIGGSVANTRQSTITKNNVGSSDRALEIRAATGSSNEAIKFFSDSTTETLRITSAGAVCINTTGEISNSLLNVAFTTSHNGMTLKPTNSTLNQNYIVFVNSAGTTAGAIRQTGTTATTYATSSDYRLKENVVDLDGAIDRVKQLQPKRFNFIADVGTTVDGFLAHEAQTVVPEAVIGEKDGEEMQGIDPSKLVPLLTAALKESIAEIESLKTRVAALEG